MDIRINAFNGNRETVRPTDSAKSHSTVGEEIRIALEDKLAIENQKEKLQQQNVFYLPEEEPSLMRPSLKSLYQQDGDKSEDKSVFLTQRLVSASGQFEVRQVLSDVNKNLLELKMKETYAKGEDAEKLRAMIQKLEKLIRRARRKIDDISDEDQKKIRIAHAERQKKIERANEIKDELRAEINKRIRREKGYLTENTQESLLQIETDVAQFAAQSAVEQEIAQQAEAIASAEIMSENMAVSFSGEDNTAAVPTGEAGFDGGNLSLGEPDVGIVTE